MRRVAAECVKLCKIKNGDFKSPSYRGEKQKNNELINNRKRLKDGIDIIDLKTGLSKRPIFI